MTLFQTLVAPLHGSTVTGKTFQAHKCMTDTGLFSLNRDLNYLCMVQGKWEQEKPSFKNKVTFFLDVQGIFGTECKGKTLSSSQSKKISDWLVETNKKIPTKLYSCSDMQSPAVHRTRKRLMSAVQLLCCSYS